MGLLDTLAGEASRALAGAGGNSHPGLMDAITGLIRDNGGGLQGLIARLQEGGLADAVASWVGVWSAPDCIQTASGVSMMRVEVSRSNLYAWGWQ